MEFPLGFVDFLSPPTLLIIGVLAILLYGERLPEVARSFGKQFMQLKKSVQSVREEFESAANDMVNSSDRPAQKVESHTHREEATAPKFEPPPSDSVADTH